MDIIKILFRINCLFRIVFRNDIKYHIYREYYKELCIICQSNSLRYCSSLYGMRIWYYSLSACRVLKTRPP